MAPHFIPQTDRYLHRISGGRIMLNDLLMPGVLLTTSGTRSGLARETPLLAIPLDGDLYVVGSNYGGDRHPAWSVNLIKEPTASVSRKRRHHDVIAHLLTPEEKASVWPRLVAIWAPYEDYTERSGRDLRVFRLSRLDGGTFE
jgi:deazaflavin-dependent oxidoreductase (nitroreductase family)